MSLVLKTPIDFEEISEESSDSTIEFSITVGDESDDPPLIANVLVQVTNMNDNRPIFVDKNGEKITRLDIYFNGIGTY